MVPVGDLVEPKQPLLRSHAAAGVHAALAELEAAVREQDTAVAVRLEAAAARHGKRALVTAGFLAMPAEKLAE